MIFRHVLISVALFGSGCSLFDPLNVPIVGPDVARDTAKELDVGVGPDTDVELKKDATVDEGVAFDTDYDVEDMGPKPETVDWSKDFDVVLEYDSASVLTNSGSGDDIVPNGAVQPTQVTDSVSGGFAGNLVAATSVQTTGVGTFETFDSMTVGTWVKPSAITSNPEIVVVGDYDIPTGVDLTINETGELICYGGNVNRIGALIVPNVINLDEWAHVVCAFDNVAMMQYAYVNGVLVDTQDQTEFPIAGSASSEFRIGNDGIGGVFEGSLDETFAIRSALSLLEVRRIYQCGIAGSDCECSEDDRYSDCRFAPCDNLPVCSLESPL